MLYYLHFFTGLGVKCPLIRNIFFLSTGSFKSLTKLKSIDISGCGKLLAIDSGAFSGCIDLQRVTISLNRYLSHISAEAFDKSMTQLKIQQAMYQRD